MKSEVYKILYEKIMHQYSYGKINFSQLKKKLQRLNRRILPIVLLFMTLCSYAYARNINTIIIHHTGENNYDISAEQIAEYHKSKGWLDIGYHYVIRRNGNIENGRAVEQIGAHAKNRNANSIGIALSGNTATEQQLKSLMLLLQALTSEYQISSIERHHEECPGSSVNVEEYNKIFCK